MLLVVDYTNLFFRLFSGCIHKTNGFKYPELPVACEDFVESVYCDKMTKGEKILL